LRIEISVMSLKSDRANATPLRDKSMGFIKFAIPSIREYSAPKPLTSAPNPQTAGISIQSQLSGNSDRPLLAVCRYRRKYS
jgi:hypothetical protein